MNAKQKVSRGLLGAAVALSLTLFGSTAAFAAVTPNTGPTVGGTHVTVDVPQLVFGEVIGGAGHSLGLAVDGTVWAWGNNQFGQLGDGTTNSSSVPVPVQPSWGAGRTITQLTTGIFSTVALADDGTVWAWGTNSVGELGDGTTTDSNVPVQVTASWGPGRTITGLTTNTSHSIAFADDGTLWAWGQNSSGQGGNGTTTDLTVPVQVQSTWGPGRTIIQTAAGSAHSVALADDGTVWAWGEGQSGQLGNGTFGDSLVPAQVTASWGAGRTITNIAAAGFGHVMALADDGSVWAWGNNQYGQLGVGTTTDSPLPTQVTASWGAERTITQIVEGDSYSLALADDGTAWNWGYGWYGQMGNGSNSEIQDVPVQVTPSWGAERAITHISVGSYHSMALTDDGSLWVWGQNSYGQFNDGTTTNSNVPVRAGWAPVSVTFDGILGTDFVDNGDGTVSVATPTHSAGSVDVVVETQYWRTEAPGPSSTTVAGFTYVAPGGNSPLAAPDSGTTAQGVPVTLDVLANDGPGATNAPLVPSSVVLAPGSSGGAVSNGGKTLAVAGQGLYTVDLITGQVTFAPESSFVGSTTPVGYTVSDENNELASATVSITVVASSIAAPGTQTPGAHAPATLASTGAAPTGLAALIASVLMAVGISMTAIMRRRRRNV
jgi:CshA-type fibril repeat protein